jgi:hypothetical protein
VQDANGIALASPDIWTFTTGALPDLTPPTVTSTNPADISKDIPINSTINATFSEAINSSTIMANGNFTLKDSASNNIAGTVSYSGITSTFTPTNNLAYATTYTATITKGVTDLAGNAMASIKTWSFTTAPWTGTRQLGVAGKSTGGSSVATDASGNVYVAGWTTGGLDGNSLTGTDDFFVTKYDSSTGAKKYTIQLGVAGKSTSGSSVATDASGNVYVAGSTNGGLDGNTLTGTQDFFVTKYNSTGVKQYTRQLGVAGKSTGGSSVATDASGNVYVAGSTYAGLDGNAQTGTIDGFVTKYDSTGVKLYTHQFGVAGAATGAQSVATDASGNVYVAGWTFGNLAGTGVSGGGEDFFVIKYDSTGVKQYIHTNGTNGGATGAGSVATDASGNVYVAGWTSGGLNGNTLTGTTDFFVTKYNSTGVWQYTRQLGAKGAIVWCYSVTTDASGNVYVGGFTNGGLDGNTLTGPNEAFVTKYDSTGGKLYTRQLGVAGAGVYTQGGYVATDANGYVYMAGTTNGALDGNTLTGTTDFFFTKYTSAGVK